ncbi:hypothetical protein OF83DRAFT_1175248 [Amylostereum chailletii]|nr:hypothetical protein OF83DRAFT_1175248 [Amylostereum chailletii]
MGGLGIMLASRPFHQWSSSLLTSPIETRPMFLVTVLAFIVLVLAYLSNPSETSFRSYLTEQSFRHHLSRLDEADNTDHSDSEDSGVHYSSRRSSPSAASLESGSSAVHFSNRASVALRTPKHDFHSFGIFTIAAVLPSAKPQPTRTVASGALAARIDLDGSSLRDVWFVGAFGRWWRGGIVDASWPARSHRRSPSSKCDDEAWSSGILNVKALDKLDKHDGLPFPTTTSPSRSAPRHAPPKLRARDRSRPRPPVVRSSTPPPLPKSATLPLHTPRNSQSLTVPQAPIPQPVHPPPHPPHHSPGNGPHIAPPPATYDNAPAVADLLRQITTTGNANHDLRSQLAEHNAVSTTVENALNDELASAREAKRVEDAGRTELKARTKTVEESKRVAEASKREAERRLRAAQTARVDARARASKLASEIAALEQRMCADREVAAAVADQSRKEEEELVQKLERRKKEVRVAEDVVAALSARARALEEDIAKEMAALEAARERAELMKQDRTFLSLTIAKQSEPGAWEPIPTTESPTQDAPPAPVDFLPDVFPTPLEKDSECRDGSRSGSSGTDSVSVSSRSREVSASPRPSPLNLRSISNLPYGGALSSLDVLARRVKGYPFDDDLTTLPAPPLSSNFSPFDADTDTDASETQSSNSNGNGSSGNNSASIPVQRSAPVGTSNVSISPTSNSLIPNSLIQSLDRAGASTSSLSLSLTDSPVDGLPSSFQSDNDAFLERDWRRRAPIDSKAAPVGSTTTLGTLNSFNNSSVRSTTTLNTTYTTGALNTSPTSVKGLPFGLNVQDEYDPFEVRPPAAMHRERLASDPIDSSRAWSMHTHTHANSTSDTPARQQERTRHWWSGGDKDKDKEKEREKEKGRGKGLNPDAKVFRFSRPKPSFAASVPEPPARAHQHVPFDSLNPSASLLSPSPNVAPSVASSTGLFSNLTMRAFAPSPAEREALHRALGGSTNASLERLPSLSEVASMPASPAHVHAHAATAVPFEMGGVGIGIGTGVGVGVDGHGKRSWLQGFVTAPRGGKIKFSPWGDGEEDQS